MRKAMVETKRRRSTGTVKETTYLVWKNTTIDSLIELLEEKD